MNFIPVLSFYLEKAEKLVDPVPDRCGGACGVILSTNLPSFGKLA
jgi:hypothetical protein